MALEHPPVVHLVDVVAGEDQDVARVDAPHAGAAPVRPDLPAQQAVDLRLGLEPVLELATRGEAATLGP